MQSNYAASFSATMAYLLRSIANALRLPIPIHFRRVHHAFNRHPSIALPSTAGQRQRAADRRLSANWASLAPRASWSTAPVATQWLGLMCATIPASLIMARLGRKRGFILGNLVGLMGAVVAVQALIGEHFGLFLLATWLIGIGIGFGQLYRFAAVEAALRRCVTVRLAWSWGRCAGRVCWAVVGQGES